MSASNARLLTLVMACFCGWSLVVLLVVESGMGGRYSLHPDDPDQIAVPPSLRLDRAQSALSELSAYAEIGERPLFNMDRRPLPALASDEPAQVVSAAPLEVLLTSVVLRGDIQVAQVTDRRSNVSQTLKVGDSLAGEQSAWKLVELAPRRAVFEGPGGRAEAELRVFDGQGGEAPTAPPVVASAAEGGGRDVVQETAPDAQAASAGGGQGAEAQTPEARAEMIRRRIEERRRQMREEAAKAAENRTQ
jgi:general secretion pathway protein N